MPFYVSTGLESIGVVAALFWLPRVIRSSTAVGEIGEHTEPICSQSKDVAGLEPVDSSSLLAGEPLETEQLGSLPEVGTLRTQPC